jgi:hypothetical protein
MTGASVSRAAAVVLDLGLIVAATVPRVAQPWAPGAAAGIPTFFQRTRADTGYFALEGMRALKFLTGRLAIESHAGDHYEDEHGTASFFGFSRLRIGDPYSLVGFVTENKFFVLCIEAKQAAKQAAKRARQEACHLGFGV